MLIVVRIRKARGRVFDINVLDVENIWAGTPPGRVRVHQIVFLRVITEVDILLKVKIEALVGVTHISSDFTFTGKFALVSL